ncbi:DNA polymerase III subunit alpha [Enterobacteriaceae endosymbiont of Donacia tomentosa]|uniref:DNA polymerase III subunit alpha n=1 Tax=Enterobacteriaceae endosymbiont of Donacia tomentosa TaxID=2675787 RepID=UPI001449BA57|nr:DNA polymerase III subunit alpha [Enterobacteriaceae endosymbiont of Donacia tomentosa]QJC31660.1 DNA polymerase III subunit alpha [Enterobacteriaceae endosymbiont of Donacia tomentosa]
MNYPYFIHLHVHSDYSMQNGLSKIEKIIEKTALLNMPAIAITDISNIFGLVKFYKIAHHYGIKAIIGADFKIENLNNGFSKLTILASNNIGYQNLKLLIADIYKNGYNNIIGPTVTYQLLKKYCQGLIILSGGVKGDIGKNILQKNTYLIKILINFYKKYFPNRFYLELIRTNRANEENYINMALEISHYFSIPLVATNEVYFLNKKDFDTHNIRVAINRGYTLNESKEKLDYSPEQFLKNTQEMCILFKDIPEALSNSVEIAKKCNVFLKLNQYFLPKFKVKNVSSPQNYLIKKSYIGLQKRLKNIYQNINIFNSKKMKYEKRLFYELNIINKMGFPSYFLIVMEFVQWAKKNSIPVGPARGSGAGSLVAYALNITNLDPIKFDLIFERFLNIERISLPDFDIDFCMDKRDLVIEHVKNVYGHNSVSQIITFGTMTAKAVIRDVGRVLGFPYDFLNQISKLIPLDIGISLKKAFVRNKKLSDLYKSDINVKELVNTALKLEGTIRNVGKHAGGVVISPYDITKYTTIYCDYNGKNVVTQFDKNDIEDIGLVKFDFLGLKTLTVIQYTLKMINEKRVKNNQRLINVDNIILNDKKIFDFLKTAQTTGIFQLESKGIKELIKQLQPDNFEDIIALLALFRPGPLQSGMVENFINRKHGRETISYPNKNWQHEKLKPILQSTYGIILYQEQVMKIAQVLANYSLGEADILRRVISKKQHKEMSLQRKRFLEGSRLLKINDILSMKIFDYLEKFSSYGFNKSHSAGYALIAYQTLWLKVYYPAEFIAAVLTSEMDNKNRIIDLVHECKNLNINILPPNINRSLYKFHVDKNGNIIYGLGAIKGIGKNQADNILNVREKYGKFKSIFDFFIKLNIKKINKRVIEALIMSGTLDCFNLNRGVLKNNLGNIINITNQYLQGEATGQIDMFNKNNFSIKQNYIDNNIKLFWSKKKIFLKEKKILGFYLTGHPINDYLTEIIHYTNNNSINKICLNYNKKKILYTKIVGIISNVRNVFNKQMQKILFLDLDDNTAKIEVHVTLNLLNKYNNILKINNIIIVEGLVYFNNFLNLFILNSQNIMSLEDARIKYLYNASIILMNEQIFNKNIFLDNLQKILFTEASSNKKKIPLYFFQNYFSFKNKKHYDKKFFIPIDENIFDKLKCLININNIKLVFNKNIY